MKYYILGVNGFVGRNVYKALCGKCNVVGLSRELFDITNHKDFVRYDFEKSIIIDCIVNIDGGENQTLEINYKGIYNFITLLNNKKTEYKYIYFSTLTTLSKLHIEKSHYVKSKHMAEEYIKKNCNEYNIIRLSFPFGFGEKENRLISKLTKKVVLSEEIILKNILLHLTSIQYLKKKVYDLLNQQSREINFVGENPIKLVDIVKIIEKEINIKSKYRITNEHNLIDLTLGICGKYNNTNLRYDIKEFVKKFHQNY